MKCMKSLLLILCILCLAMSACAESALEGLSISKDDLVLYEDYSNVDFAALFSDGYGEAIEMDVISANGNLSVIVDQGADPFIPEGMELETVQFNILGSDDRVKVSNTSAYPYSAVSYLVVHGQCGCDWTGTGFMVSKNTLMTAAHCLVCTDHGKKLEYANFYFGYKSSQDYLYKYGSQFTYWVGTTFDNHGYSWEEENKDYAYVKFEKNVGNTTGWFGMTALGDSSTNTGYYCIAGYRDKVLTKNWGTCTVFNTNMCNFSMDSLPGNSGCPIFNSDYYVSSICVAQSHDGTKNWAYRIQGWLISEMRNKGLFD